MKLKATVKDTTLKHISGTNKAGRPYSFNKQTIWVYMPNQPYPERVEVIREQPLPLGDHVLDLTNNIQVNNGRIEIRGDFEFAPMPAKAA